MGLMVEDRFCDRALGFRWASKSRPILRDCVFFELHKEG